MSVASSALPDRRRTRGPVTRPVTWVVGVELVVAAGLIALAVTTLAAAVVVAAVVVLAGGWTLRVRGRRLGERAWIAVTYGCRRRTWTPAVGRSDGSLSADVRAVLPGLGVRGVVGRTLADAETDIGLVRCGDRWSAVVELGGDERDVLTTEAPAVVPVDRFVTALGRRGLDLAGLQLLTRTMCADAGRAGSTFLDRVVAELTDADGLCRGRECWLVVRIDPVAAARALTVRGGGSAALGRLAGAALSRVEIVARDAGLHARVLGVEQVTAAVASTLVPPSRSEAGTRWVEGWRSVTSAGAHHASFGARTWSDRALDALGVTSGLAVHVAHDVEGIEDGALRVSSVVRLTAVDGASLARATAQLRAGCDALGVDLRPLPGQQALGLRSSVLGARP